MVAVSEHLDEFRAVSRGDVPIALVTFTEAADLDDYRERHGIHIPILLDPDRSAYRAYGLGRASAARVWSPATLRRYTSILRRDGLGALRRPTEDTRQLGGDFVIDPTGRLSWGFWSDGPDDRPTVDELLAAVRTTAPG